MMKKLLLPLLLLVMAAPAWAAGPPPPPQVQPKFLLLDRQTLLRTSKVGQDVTRQVEAYGNQIKAEVAGEQKSLAAEAQQLQQQVAILAPDVKAKKIAAFEAKQAGAEAAAQKKQQMIQGGFLKAQAAISQTLEPILVGIMQQRGANLIFDKQAVVFASPQAAQAFDITQAAVDQLNQKLPSFKVELVAPPQAPGK